MDFAFRTAPVLFGPGKRRAALAEARRFGDRVLLVTGASSLERSGFLAEVLDTKDASITHYAVSREPDPALVDEGVRRCREARCNVVLGIGGGSTLDSAKAIAAIAANGGETFDYLEEIGGGRAIAREPLPLIAVPTTAGSGSEVTKNSVIKVAEAAVKRSIRSDLMYPRLAIVDPELSGSAPKEVAAPAGLDALTHLIEAYVSRGAQPITDALALPGIRMAYRALSALAADGFGPLREEMALASLWGGIVLANAGLGAIHGLVAPLCGQKPIPHGTGCAALLPEGFRANIEALRRRDPGNRALGRYREVAAALNDGNPDVERAASALAALRSRLGVPRLSALGVSTEDVSPLVAGCRGGSMRSNPIALTDEELAQLLEAALE